MLNSLSSSYIAVPAYLFFRPPSQYVAIKVLKKSTVVEENSYMRVWAEHHVLARHDSPFLTHMQAAFQTDTRLYFVMEFMVGGGKSGERYFDRKQVRISEQKEGIICKKLRESEEIK